MDRQKTRFCFVFRGPALPPQIFDGLNVAILETTMVLDARYVLVKMQASKNCRGRQVLKAIETYNKFVGDDKRINLIKLDGQADEIVSDLDNNPILSTIRDHRLKSDLPKRQEEAKDYTLWKNPSPGSGRLAGKRPREGQEVGEIREKLEKVSAEAKETQEKLEKANAEAKEAQDKLKQAKLTAVKLKQNWDAAEAEAARHKREKLDLKTRIKELEAQLAPKELEAQPAPKEP